MLNESFAEAPMTSDTTWRGTANMDILGISCKAMMENCKNSNVWSKLQEQRQLLVTVHLLYSVIAAFGLLPGCHLVVAFMRTSIAQS